MRKRTIESKSLIVIKQLFNDRSSGSNNNGLDDRGDN